MDIECAHEVGPLFDDIPALSPREREVLKTRFIGVLDAAEKGADRAEAMDTTLFLVGFIGSLVVTVATAVNLAGFVNASATAAVSTTVLILSSIGTAAMGLRERLKFRDKAVVLRRTSSHLQRSGFLYLAGAGPYESLADAPMRAYRAFFQDIETIKAGADSATLHLRNSEDGGDAPAPAPAPATATTTTTTVAAPNAQRSRQRTPSRTPPSRTPPHDHVTVSLPPVVAAPFSGASASASASDVTMLH
jgi:hypothetical protein